nr:MAK10-like protein [Tanacetum cinerariifolium]
DKNPIRTLGDYSKPNHEGYRNTIKLPEGNNVAPLRSDTIRLLQNRCSFHGLRSEDPTPHLKDFLKLVDSFDFNELTVSRTPKKVLVREDARYPVTKIVNSISLVRTVEEKSTKDEAMFNDISGKPDKSKAVVSPKKVKKENEAENATRDKLVNSAEEKPKKIDEEKTGKTTNSQSVGYYLRHKINKKLVEGLVNNQKFNDSLLATRMGKMK